MDQASLLKTLFCQCSFNRNAPLRAVVESFIDEHCLEERLIPLVLPIEDLASDSLSFIAVLEKWRALLTLILVLNDKNCIDTYKVEIIKYARQLQLISPWREHQLLSMYKSVVAFYLEKHFEDYDLSQLPNGACPLQSYSLSGIVGITHPLYHAELGVLCCLYADLTGQAGYKESALKITEWQFNTLDHDFLSFAGLFANEGESSERLLLINNYLLFNAVARIDDCAKMAFLAEKQLKRLAELADQESLDIPGYSILLESYFSGIELPAASTDYYLPASFQDSHFGFAGSRSAESSAVATLYGGKSGMGCYHFKDVKVINYGPQYTPLGDCAGFGIEGGGQLLSEFVTELSATTGEFILQGMSRMSSLSLEGVTVGESHSPHAGWLATCQELKDQKLSIKTQFQNLFEQKELLFSFFVKCKQCVVDGNRIVSRRSLNRYSGKSAQVEFQGVNFSLILQTGQNHEEMHVIPLGGGDNFWGADFLVAYKLKDDARHYTWEIA